MTQDNMHVLLATLQDTYLAGHDEICDSLLDAIQRLRKYDEVSLTEQIHILTNLDQLRKAELECAESGDLLPDEVVEPWTDAQGAMPTIQWLTGLQPRLTQEDRAAVKALRDCIENCWVEGAEAIEEPNGPECEKTA